MITNLLNKYAYLTIDGQVVFGKICAIFGESQQGFSVAIEDRNGKIHIGWASQLTMAKKGTKAKQAESPLKPTIQQM